MLDTPLISCFLISPNTVRALFGVLTNGHHNLLLLYHSLTYTSTSETLCIAMGVCLHQKGTDKITEHVCYAEVGSPQTVKYAMDADLETQLE